MADNAAIAKAAAELGHEAGAVMPTESGRRYFGQCSCGHVTHTKVSYRQAVDALIWHIHRAIRDAQEAGKNNGGRRDTPSDTLRAVRLPPRREGWR